MRYKNKEYDIVEVLSIATFYFAGLVVVGILLQQVVNDNTLYGWISKPITIGAILIGMYYNSKRINNA